MMDGFTAEVKNIDRDSWLSKVNLAPEFLVNSNGEQVWKVSSRGRKYRREDCSFRGYNIGIITTAGIGDKLHLGGSFHKSCRGENYSQFKFLSLQNEINRLCEELKLDPELIKLQNLEIGLNLSWHTNPIEFLVNNLLGFKGEPMNKYDPDELGSSIGYYQKRQRYVQKLYDKSLQYGLSDRILRPEIHTKKMIDLQEFHISNFKDLTDPIKVYPLKNYLIKKTDYLIFTDQEIDPKKLPSRKAEIFKIGHSGILQKNTGMGAKERWNFMKEFEEIVREYGTDYKAVLKERISQTWEPLFSEELTTLQKIEVGRINHFAGDLKNGRINHFATEDLQCNSGRGPKAVSEELTERYRVNSSGIQNQGLKEEGKEVENSLSEGGGEKGSKIDPAAGQKKCQVTQIPLTGKARHFLTEKMVRELKEKDPLTFKKLRRGFGQKKGQKSTSKKVTDECYFIAHNIRNLYWNKVYQKQARKPAGNNPLF